MLPVAQIQFASDEMTLLSELGLGAEHLQTLGASSVPLLCSEHVEQCQKVKEFAEKAHDTDLGKSVLKANAALFARDKNELAHFAKHCRPGTTWRMPSDKTMCSL